MSFTPLLPNNSHFSKTFPGLRSRARSPAGLGRRRTHASSFMHSGEQRTTGRRQRGRRSRRRRRRRRRRALPLPPSLSYIGAPASSVAVHAVSSVQRFCGQFLHASRGICVHRFEAFCEMSLSKKSKILPSVRPSVPLFFKEKAAEGTRKETRDRPERVKRARARTAPAFSSGGSRRPRVARMPSSLPLCSLGSLSHFVALSSFGGEKERRPLRLE